MGRGFGHCPDCEAPIASQAAHECRAPDCPVKLAKAAVASAVGPDAVECECCRNIGLIDQRLGGVATSGWIECPDCHNENGELCPR